MEPSNYRPLKVLINLSVYFESTIDDQLDILITNFIPGIQFGFVKGTGTMATHMMAANNARRTCHRPVRMSLLVGNRLTSIGEDR